MILRKPTYFDTFVCIAGACPDSCCKEWEVLVDEATAQRYLALPGTLGDDLRRLLRREEDEWYITICSGRCPMWRTDGLCRIQAEQGHDALCQTCQEFPRLTHDYGDFVERGLELSCPEAARIIFANPLASWEETELPGGEESEYDADDMALLLETRAQMLKILSNERYTVAQALALGLMYGYHAQSLLDGAEAIWDDGESLSFAKSLAKPADPAQLTAFYAGLEILTDAWRERLQHCGAKAWDENLRTLAKYGVERYWLQAISDFDLVGRVKMVILSCLLVRTLGGSVMSTAQLYAKEIENNAANVDAILDGAYASPALTDDRILGFLLCEEENE